MNDKEFKEKQSKLFGEFIEKGMIERRENPEKLFEFVQDFKKVINDSKDARKDDN